MSTDHRPGTASDGVIVIGAVTRRPGSSDAAYDELGERMWSIVSRMPGFISVKNFRSDDGEELTIWRFASEDALEAWRTHPEHVDAIRRGRSEFYSSVQLQICRVVRRVQFERAEAA